MGASYYSEGGNSLANLPSSLRRLSVHCNSNLGFLTDVHRFQAKLPEKQRLNRLTSLQTEFYSITADTVNSALTGFPSLRRLELSPCVNYRAPDVSQLARFLHTQSGVLQQQRKNDLSSATSRFSLLRIGSRGKSQKDHAAPSPPVMEMVLSPYTSPAFEVLKRNLNAECDALNTHIIVLSGQKDDFCGLSSAGAPRDQ